ncbi:MAG: hydantoinase/oxoprolinase family protein [Pseudomonadota bacterium]
MNDFPSHTDGARLAVDIGGTFTDVALSHQGRLITAKTLTTPQAPDKGVLNGVGEAIAKAGIAASDISVIIHGTTLATNALIERRGAVTAMLTTHGHRDVIEMAQENRFEQYDINIDRPAPLTPRWLRLPVIERLNARGEILTPLDEASVRACLPTLDAEAVESVAICFLHAYANPAHEQRTAEIIADARPDLSVTLASETAPEIREYERFSTAVANAYVRPLMARYLVDLESRLKAAGFDCPFLLMTSGGGLTTVETARRFPVRLVESGPAGGAVLAAAIAREKGVRSLLSFDMGGTTAKLCLIDDCRPETARLFEVDRSYRFKKGSGLPVRIPVIDMVEIGAGGGSLASIDALKRITVGPESAGSEPGPAAYGRGGDKPAVTDADVVLGKIDPETFGGGAFRLDEAAARAAIDRTLAQPFGLPVEEAAFAMGDVVDENMASAARAHAVEQGADISARTMTAFGGAAPLHAARLAEKLGIETVIIPANAGVGSAIGFLLAPAAYEVVRSLPTTLDAFSQSAVRDVFASMAREAAPIVRAAQSGTAAGAPLKAQRRAYMRYVGQGHEIPVDVDLDAEDLKHNLRERFETAYAALYGRAIPNVPIEILTWALLLEEEQAEETDAAMAQAVSGRAVTSARTRRVFDPTDGTFVHYAVFERRALQPGDKITGPALIIEPQTTTVAPSLFDAFIDASLNIVLQRKSSL